jgi:hypothetical protein
MSETTIGYLFIAAGVVYGSLAIDWIYNHTLGLLVNYNFVKTPPKPGKDDLKTIIGRKATILVYASILIIIGLFILWKQ